MSNVVVDGVTMAIHVRRREQGQVLVAAADVAGAEGLKLSVHRGFVYSLTMQLFGIQDLAVGDAVFDDRFIVKGNDPAFVRAWLDPEVRRHIMVVEDGRYRIARGRLRAQVDVTEDTIRAMSPRFMETVAALARRAQGLTDEWRVLAATLGARVDGGLWRADGTFGLEVPIGQRSARVDLWWKRGLFTRVRAQNDGAGQLAARRAAVAADVARLAPARLEADDRYVTILDRGHVTDGARLRALAGLAVALGTAPGERGGAGAGPYR